MYDTVFWFVRFSVRCVLFQNIRDVKKLKKNRTDCGGPKHYLGCLWESPRGRPGSIGIMWSPVHLRASPVPNHYLRPKYFAPPAPTLTHFGRNCRFRLKSPILAEIPDFGGNLADLAKKCRIWSRGGRIGARCSNSRRHHGVRSKLPPSKRTREASRGLLRENLSLSDTNSRRKFCDVNRNILANPGQKSVLPSHKKAILPRMIFAKNTVLYS